MISDMVSEEKDLEVFNVANLPSKEYLESLYEVDLPESIRHDLDAYQKGLQEEHCLHLDCLFNELQGSINGAYHGGEISKEQYQYLWKKYIWEDTEFLD